jgi:hypothetical protein
MAILVRNFHLNTISYIFMQNINKILSSVSLLLGGMESPFRSEFKLNFLGGKLLVNVGDDVNFIFEESFISLVQITIQ